MNWGGGEEGEGEREGKSVGDERSQRDPREGGYEDKLKGRGCFWWGGPSFMVVRAADGN